MNTLIQPIFDNQGNRQEPKTASVHSFAKLWAKKYVQNLQSNEQPEEIKGVTSNFRRTLTAEKMMQSLRSVSLQSWSKTEKLIAKEVVRHQINSKLIDPWQISEDSFRIFEKPVSVMLRCSKFICGCASWRKASPPFNTSCFPCA